MGPATVTTVNDGPWKVSPPVSVSRAGYYTPRRPGPDSAQADLEFGVNISLAYRGYFIKA